MFKKPRASEKVIIRTGLGVCFLITASVLSLYLEFYHQWLKVLPLFLFSLALWNLPLIFSARREKVSLILGLILLFSILNGSFPHINLGASRDYGGYVANAIVHTKEASFKVKQVDLLFPALSYSLGSKYLIPGHASGYPVYLSLFYSYFGLTGLFWANFPLVFLGLACLFFITQRLSNKRSALLAIILVITNYMLIYFSRRTLSENLNFFLFWFSVFLFILAWQTKEMKFLLWAFIPAIINIFVRVEMIFYFLTLTCIVLTLTHFKKIRFKLSRQYLGPCTTIVLTTLIYLFYAYHFLPTTYLQIFRAGEFILRKILDPFTKYLTFIPKTPSATSIKDAARPLQTLLYVGQLLFFYNIIFYIVIAILGFFKKSVRKEIYLVFILALPSLLYLYDPLIARDQPWALRRYFPIFFPMVVIISSIILESLFSLSKKTKKMSVSLIVCFLLINQLSFSVPILFYKQNETQDRQLKQFVNLFPPNSKIIFPENYFDFFGRFTTVLRYHYSLNTFWPVYYKNKPGSAHYNEREIVIEKLGTLSPGRTFFVSQVNLEQEDVTVSSFVDNSNLLKVAEFPIENEQLRVPRSKTSFPPTKPIVERTTYYIYTLKEETSWTVHLD